jgi:hypothetical protein
MGSGSMFLISMRSWGWEGDSWSDMDLREGQCEREVRWKMINDFLIKNIIWTGCFWEKGNVLFMLKLSIVKLEYSKVNLR